MYLPNRSRHDRYLGIVMPAIGVADLRRIVAIFCCARVRVSSFAVACSTIERRYVCISASSRCSMSLAIAQEFGSAG